jgi:hypothetical protein
MRSSYNMKSVIVKAIITATANTLTLVRVFAVAVMIAFKMQTYTPLKVRGITQVVSKHSQRCCSEMAILLLEKPQFNMVN